MGTVEAMLVAEDAETTAIYPLIDNTITDISVDSITTSQLSQDNTNDLVSTTNTIFRNIAPLTPKSSPSVDKIVSDIPRQRNLFWFAESETDYTDFYDRNGEKVPFFDVIDLEGGGANFGKISPPSEPLENEADTEVNANEAVLPNDILVDIYIPILDEEQLKLLVPALRVELKKIGQSLVDNKAILRSRLRAALLDNVPVYTTTR